MLKPVAMRRFLVGLVVGVVFCGAGMGCKQSLHGHWELVQAVPNRDTFSLDDLSFRPDGTFSATTTFEGRTKAESGTYDFNGFKLWLRPQAGGQREYLASVKLGRLQIKDGDRRAVLERTGKAKSTGE